MRPLFSAPVSRLPLLILALAAACFVAGSFLRPFSRRENPLLTTPVLALETLQARTLYFNGAARPWLLAQRPELLAAEDREAGSEHVRAMAQAVQNPKLFRQLDRAARFDAVLLTGDPSQFRPLLDHLVETKDWALAYADPTSLVFRRDRAQPWTPGELQPVRARLAAASAKDRATFLAQTGIRLNAAGRADAGRPLLEEATQLDPRLPDGWNGIATLHMSRGEWREAQAAVERALALDRDFLPAIATKAQLLYATKNFSEAYDLSQRLIERLPDDPNLLFYHAKIAHEAKAYQAEIEALKKLIASADADARPVAGYQIYLGQAYTTTGEARRAIDAFMDALNDPDLPDDQRSFARENIARIKKRTGL